MADDSISGTGAQPEDEPRASWMPLIVIVMAQVLMVFNVATMQVSIEGLSSSLNVPATYIGTAIVTYALCLAALILLGARIVQIYGSRRAFRAAVALFGAAMVLMAASYGMAMAIVAQVVAGTAASVLVPTLVVLLAENYSGAQQAKALGWLGGALAMGIVLAFLIAGMLGAWLGWRLTYGLLVLFAGGIVYLSQHFGESRVQTGVQIDAAGIVLAAGAVFLVSMGANNLTAWGVLLATPRAPFAFLDMSPAPVMIVAGVFLGQAFITWSRRREAHGRAPLVALEVVDTPEERAALFSIFAISAFGSAITFLIPLYIQIVQGGSSLDTAAAVVPLSLASVAAAVLVVRLYGRMSPRVIGRYAFLAVAIGIVFLAAVIRNEWSNSMVMLGMTVIGIGEGALVTLLFNVLVTASPQALAGDVGSLRGTINNIATAAGTAIASALVVSVLGTSVHHELVHNEVIPLELKSEVNLDNVAFVSNDRLRQFLASTSATPEQVDEAERINTDARLIALKVTFFALAGLALLAYFPAGALPSAVRIPAASSARARAITPARAQ